MAFTWPSSARAWKPKRPNQSDIRQQCYPLLREYLAVPRPSMWDHWKAWRQQGLPEDIQSLLQTQCWFETTRGRMSWRQQLAEPEAWLYPRRLPGRQPIWKFQGHLVLHRDHPNLRPWLGSEEPQPIQTSLLLSLVCAINAISQPLRTKWNSPSWSNSPIRYWIQPPEGPGLTSQNR